ncbi:DUF814 domain-containing protein [Candidatus Micrarchaeota archaeon]|nr:DUF814 domain-containing protein [Candidatus Micrarchaeota archaeon]
MSLEIILDASKSLEENAAKYYEQAKKLKKKREGLVKALEVTRKKIRSQENRLKYAKSEKRVTIKVSRERMWFEKFHHFITSGGKRCLAGRDAKQNELLVAKHMDAQDLFFHADVHGASAVVLKEGQHASEEEKNEAAQFAACFSSAWKAQHAIADVFSANPQQVSKYSHGEFVAKGGFMIYGKKNFHRHVPLKIRLVRDDRRFVVFPESHSVPASTKNVLLVPGSRSKHSASLTIAKKLDAEHIPGVQDEISRLLPGTVEFG